MKILGTGDLHFTERKPKNRIDDYKQAQRSKWKQIVSIYMDSMCSVLGSPGDIFESYKEPHGLVEWVIRSANERFIDPIRWFSVFGQHDQLHHTKTKTNSPLGVVLAGCPNAVCLGAHRTLVPQPPNERTVAFYGASWGEEIPEPVSDKDVNVLLMHRMVIHKEKLWEDQEVYEDAVAFLKKHPFDFVLSGDNHQYFTASYRGRVLFNGGSLMRSTIAQRNHIPHICIYDTETKQLETIPLKVEPIESVMDFSRAEQEEHMNEFLDRFIARLKVHNKVSLDFRKNLDDFMELNKFTPDVVDIINEIMES